jgi:membrane protein
VSARPREIVERAKGRWRAAKQNHAWLDHTVIAWSRYKQSNGNYFAAAITYFSFLALFPLVLLAVSVLGFVLQHNPDLLRKLLDNVTSNVPGAFGDTLKSSINAAIDSRAGVGVLALAGVLLIGLGWVSNLRAAINAMWGVEGPPKRNVLKARLADLIVLAGLGLGSVVSIGLTAVGTALTDHVLRAAGLDDVTGMHALVKVFGIALAVAGDVLIFAWLLVRLPGADLPARVVLRGALLAAVGFEVLKVVGAYYIARVTHSPTVGVFGSVIGLLVWIYLVARFLLYCAAWTATATATERPEPPAEPEPEPEPATEPESTTESEPGPPRILSPLGVAGSLFGAGAAAGAAVVAAIVRRRRRPISRDR